ncbi:MAG: 2-hydroxyacyl-CoA dehydratase family protein [Promethearchaeota archaeon]
MPAGKMGWFCSYTPLELLRAAGFEHFRVIGHSGPIREADAHVHSATCQYVRSCIDVLVEGGYDDLVGVVGVNSCDAMRRLLDVWTAVKPGTFSHEVDLPVGRTDGDVEYLAVQFRKLADHLGEFAGRPVFIDALKRSAAVFERAREAFHRLSASSSSKPPGASGADLAVLAHQFFFSDPEEWTKRALEKAGKGKSAGDGGRAPPRLLVAGSPVHDPRVVRLFEDVGFDVVYADFCTGSRFFGVAVDIEAVDRATDVDSVLRELARAYLNRAPCARMMMLDERAANILAAVRNYGADAVLHYALKFCDVYQYDAPALKRRLDEAGVPSLFVEGDGTLGGVEQLKTRLEAFLEILEGGN